MLETYTRRPSSFDEILISCDTAMTAKTSADFTSMGVFGRKGMDCYLVDEVHEQIETWAVIKRLKALLTKWPAVQTTLIENKGNGIYIIEETKELLRGITPVDGNNDKELEIRSVLPIFENGNFWLPDPDYARFLGIDIEGFVAELSAFPAGKHDDRVIMVKQALLWWLPNWSHLMKGKMVEADITPEDRARESFEKMQAEIKKMGNKPGKSVARVKTGWI